MQDEERECHWKTECDVGMNSIKRLGEYRLERAPENRKHISTRWLFLKNEDENGNVVSYKSIWVVKGFMQSYGVYDYLTRVPVSKISTLHVLLVDSSTIPLIKITFSLASNVRHQRVLKRNISRSHFRCSTPVPKVQSIRLLKALYGLKQAPRVWNATLGMFLRQSAVINPVVRISSFTVDKNTGKFK